MRKNKAKTIFKIMLLLIFIAAISFSIYYYKTETDKRHAAEINLLKEEMASYTQLIYVACADIKVGEILEEDVNVTLQSVVTKIDGYVYIDSSDLGKQAIVNIETGIPITTNMLSDIVIADDTRIYDTGAVTLMSDQTDYDVVDIRIMFPDGSDYLLLSKKSISNVNMETNRFNMMLNTEEIMRYTCALVDAYCVTGTKIYTVRYIEPNLQEAGIPNYPIRAYVINLMQADPNVATLAEKTMETTARDSLEDSLSSLSEEQLNAMASGNDVVDNANSSALINGYIPDNFISSDEETPEVENSTSDVPEDTIVDTQAPTVQ